MDKDLGELLRDLFLGATLDGEEVQGIDFTPYNDGAVLLNIRTCKPFAMNYTDSIAWHQMIVPGTNLQMVRDRLASVPGVLSSLVLGESSLVSEVKDQKGELP